MRADNDRIRSLAAQAKANAWTVKIVGPDVIAISPDGQQQRRIGSSGKLSDQDRIELEGEWGVKKIEATGAQQRATERVRTEGDVTVKQTVDPNKPAGGAATSVLERNRQAQSKMRDLYELTPEARKFITTKDGGKTFTMSTRPVVADNWFAADVTQEDVDRWDELKKEIDPTYTPPAPKGASTTPRVPAGTNLPVPTNQLQTKKQAAASVARPNTGQAIPRPAQLPQGMIEITKDGQSGMIPANQEAEAIRQGWKKVR